MKTQCIDEVKNGHSLEGYCIKLKEIHKIKPNAPRQIKKAQSLKPPKTQKGKVVWKRLNMDKWQCQLLIGPISSHMALQLKSKAARDANKFSGLPFNATSVLQNLVNN